MKHILIFIAFLICQPIFAQDQMYDICPLKIGADIPSTYVYDAANKKIPLAELVADKPTVLVFYRGAWCGYCTKHLAELNDTKADIEALGYQILGITVDQYQKLGESLERSESEIEVYSDASLETITAFGLDWKVDAALFDKYKNEYKLDLEDWSGENHHSLPVPSIYVIQDGMISFQYVNPNYRKRMKATSLLALLETL